MDDQRDFVSLLTQWSAKKMAKLEMRKLDPTHCVVVVNEAIKADVSAPGAGLNWKKIKQMFVVVVSSRFHLSRVLPGPDWTTLACVVGCDRAAKQALIELGISL